jgi:hypothetical protein
MGSMSTIYTIGTLLSRAESSGQRVRVLVEGHWITGTPLSCDGHGVILDGGADGQVLVRVEAISAAAYALPDRSPDDHPSDSPVPRQRSYDSTHDGAYEGEHQVTAGALG